ncbi:cupin domain-containing protein [Bacteroides finegoldii]|nr:cupin domain-containing protein [Bacteroides finegoldii]
MGLLMATLIVSISCVQKSTGDTIAESKSEDETRITLKDYGNAPTVVDIEAYTIGNDNFRTTLWTGTNLQVTLMTIPAGGDIGLEQHPDIDQFLRIEQGEGRVLMGDTQDKLDFVKEVKADYAVFVPAGKWHNLVNTGNTPIKLYSIYAPVEHPHSTIHKTQAEALEAEHVHETGG